MTCASPSASPAYFAGSSRASIQVRIAKRLAGGRPSLPLSPKLSAYLPFSPVTGNIYTYSATINVTLNESSSNTPGTGSNWLGMGFTNTAIQATGSTNRWSDTGGPGAAAWMLHRGAYNSTTDTTFGGPGGTNNVAVAAPAGTITRSRSAMTGRCAGSSITGSTWSAARASRST